MTSSIKKIVILGGGTAGWMTASSLAKHLKGLDIELVVIESSKIASVGVGEATIPSIRSFCASLGIDEVELMTRTKATCKLGIEFKDWSQQGDSFFHPFGLYGTPFRSVDFHHYWLRLFKEGKAEKIEGYSLAAVLARAKKFTRPVPQPQSHLSVFDWALHFDADLFAKFLKDYSRKLGVVCLDQQVLDVTLNQDSGYVESLSTDSGIVSADFFIDCSGFKALLVGKALGVAYEDWSHYLPTDSAVVAQCDMQDGLHPYTRSTAHEAGWQWRIPLQNRVGNGYVYSSKFCTDDQAESIFLKNLESEPITAPRIIRFKTGRREVSWHKNVVAIGLSAGFLEPLESTSISLIETSIDRLLKFFPNGDLAPDTIKEFNYRARKEMENIRDFLILHYKASSRDDSDFWRYCRNMDIPSELECRIRLFKAGGHIKKYEWDSFQEPSWITMFLGFGILPDSYHPIVDTLDIKELELSLRKMKQSLIHVTDEAPSHAEFINTYVVSNDLR